MSTHGTIRNHNSLLELRGELFVSAVPSDTFSFQIAGCEERNMFYSREWSFTPDVPPLPVGWYVDSNNAVFWCEDATDVNDYRAPFTRLRPEDDVRREALAALRKLESTYSGSMDRQLREHFTNVLNDQAAKWGLS